MAIITRLLTLLKNKIAQKRGFSTWTKLETAVINGTDIQVWSNEDRPVSYGFGNGPMHSTERLSEQSYDYQQSPPDTIWWTVDQRVYPDLDANRFMDLVRETFKCKRLSLMNTGEIYGPAYYDLPPEIEWFADTMNNITERFLLEQ